MAQQLKLPKFEGQPVNVTKLKVNGIAGNPSRAFKVGDVLYLLTEVVIDAVEHVEREGLLTRLHKARIRQYGEMDPTEANDTLVGMQEAARRAAEDEAGIVPLFRDAHGNQIGQEQTTDPDDPEED